MVACADGGTRVSVALVKVAAGNVEPVTR